jgi:HEAT repeat protein
MIAAVVAIVVAILAIVIVTARGRRSAATVTTSSQAAQPLQTASPAWTGDEYAGLSDAARCDLVFALQELPGEERTSMLLDALDDPSETVALAAAKALTARGERARVDGYLERHPGARSERLSNDLSLLS